MMINRRKLILSGFGFATALSVPKILNTFGELPINYISPEANMLSNILLFGADPNGLIDSTAALEMAAEAGMKYSTPIIIRNGTYLFKRSIIIDESYPRIIVDGCKILMANNNSWVLKNYKAGFIFTNNYFIGGEFDNVPHIMPISKPIYQDPNNYIDWI